MSNPTNFYTPWQRANLMFNLVYDYECTEPWTDADLIQDCEATIRQLARLIMSDRSDSRFRKTFKTVRRFKNWFDKEYPSDRKYLSKV